MSHTGPQTGTHLPESHCAPEGHFTFAHGSGGAVTQVQTAGSSLNTVPAGQEPLALVHRQIPGQSTAPAAGSQPS